MGKYHVTVSEGKATLTRKDKSAAAPVAAAPAPVETVATPAANPPAQDGPPKPRGGGKPDTE